jgi:hypothetical protein
MHVLKRNITILILTLALALAQPAMAHAIYSSRLAEKVSQIRSDLITARLINGTGSVQSAVESVKAQNKLNRENKTAEGIPAKATEAQRLVFDDVMRDIFSTPFDSFFMIFNLIFSTGQSISVCLRNDIWTLEDLKDLTVQEMIKAYMLYDLENGDKLIEDYKYLMANIRLLKAKGPDPNSSIRLGDEYMSSTEYFFGNPSSDNLYQFHLFSDEGCQDGEFDRAFEQVGRSAKTLETLGTGQGADWGNIREMAEANAKRKAAQWIKANQISLSIGGKRGGNQQSLIKGGGFDKFVGSLKTELGILKNMIGPVTPLFDSAKYATGTGSAGLSDNGYCVYYSTTDGQWTACTVDQLKDYEICQGNDVEAKKGINCSGYKIIGGDEYVMDKIRDYQTASNKNEAAIQEATDIYTYSLNLSFVSDESLTFFDKKLGDINAIIKQSNEQVDEQAGKGLPSLLNIFMTLSKNHCTNKPVALPSTQDNTNK